jgi:hypothetical protein
MVEARRNRDFAEEALVTERSGQFGSENLQCDKTIVLQIMREIYSRHTATAQLTMKGVVLSESSFKAFELLAHATPPMLGVRCNALACCRIHDGDRAEPY